jgi:hypothetical protein
MGMARSILFLVGCVAFVCNFASAADDDPVGKQLAAAKQEYERAVEKARAGLLLDLEKKREAARKDGDFKLVERVRAETRAFEEVGIPPRIVSVTSYQGQIRTAHTRLEEVQATAVKQYTKEGKVKLARITQEDLDEIKDAGAMTATVTSGSGWVDLFNGKDTDGWRTPKGDTSKWSVGEGTLTSGGESGYLVTKKNTFENFQLHVVTQIDVGANSGIMFRVPEGKAPLGYEAEINTTDPEQSGTLGVTTDKWRCLVLVKKSPVPSNRWYTMLITAEGNRFEISINGKIITRYIDIDSQFTEGAIALQHGRERAAVSFKKIRIKELPPAKK